MFISLLWKNKQEIIRRNASQPEKESEKESEDGFECVDVCLSENSDEKKKTHKVTLKIRFIDVSGYIIGEEKPTDMFVKFIKYIGSEKVYNLKIPYEDSLLVDVKRTSKYFGQWKYLSGGFWVNGHSCTDRKIRQMKKIANLLGINVHIETYKIDA